MMDQEVKARWVEALRSGKYKQGQGRLEQDGCNCCLGVLARLQGVETIENERSYVTATKFVFGSHFNSRIFVPDGFCGLSGNNVSDVALRNDKGESFAAIADHIEANF